VKKADVYVPYAENVSYTPSDITNWHHYSISYDAGSLKAYIDGEEVASGTVGDTLSSDTGVVTVGRDDGLVRYGDVLEDDVRIYDRVLSQKEIQRLYNMGR